MSHSFYKNLMSDFRVLFPMICLVFSRFETPDHIYFSKTKSAFITTLMLKGIFSISQDDLSDLLKDGSGSLNIAQGRNFDAT
ncbi:hypothetical protein [Leptospira stimsonii]|nr:hypothetical protein [Leptospira stimsonii]